jgi:hypothetical protein
MAKHKAGGLKIRQKGFVKPKSAKKTHKKTSHKAPWSDPLKELTRGGNRR